MKNDWKNYKEESAFHRGSSQYWEVKLFSKDGEGVYAYVFEYPPIWYLLLPTYEVEIQIPEEISITGHTINATVFAYKQLDLPRFKRHAKRVAKALTAI